MLTSYQTDILKKFRREFHCIVKVATQASENIIALQKRLLRPARTSLHCKRNFSDQREHHRIEKESSQANESVFLFQKAGFKSANAIFRFKFALAGLQRHFVHERSPSRGFDVVLDTKGRPRKASMCVFVEFYKLKLIITIDRASFNFKKRLLRCTNDRFLQPSKHQ